MLGERAVHLDDHRAWLLCIDVMHLCDFLKPFSIHQLKDFSRVFRTYLSSSTMEEK